jgi:hypothetical protein
MMRLVQRERGRRRARPADEKEKGEKRSEAMEDTAMNNSQSLLSLSSIQSASHRVSHLSLRPRIIN